MLIIATPQFKITACIEKLSYGLDLHYVGPVEYETWLQGVSAVKLDVSSRFLLSSCFLNLSQNLAAETAAYLTTKHPDYAVLAARIAISNLHKETKKSFSQLSSSQSLV